MDFGHTSDPYCKLFLFPSTDTGTKWNFKTTVKKHTLQPEFNEEFIFQNIQLKDLISKTLQITVYDKDIGKKDDYIGKYIIYKSQTFLKPSRSIRQENSRLQDYSLPQCFIQHRSREGDALPEIRIFGQFIVFALPQF
jgi:hypothetical protein